MAWRRPGDKPLSEPIVVRLPTHICVTRPQWVKCRLHEYNPDPNSKYLLEIWKWRISVVFCDLIFQFSIDLGHPLVLTWLPALTGNSDNVVEDHMSALPGDSGLAHWNVNKMANILQMTILSAFYWMKLFVFWGKFLYNVFLSSVNNIAALA